MLTQEQIKKEYDKLPDDIKQAISSVDTTGIIIDIGEKYQLHIDQIGKLVDEVGLVMLGFTKSNQFVSNVEKRLKISREKSNILVREINDKILIKIRESMRKHIDEEGFDVEQTQKYTEQTWNDDEKIKKDIEIEDRETILREIEDSEDESNAEQTRNYEEQTQKDTEKIINEKEKVVAEEIKETPSVFSDKKEGGSEQVSSTFEKVDDKQVSQEITIPKHTEIIENKLTEVVKMPITEKKIIDNNIKQLKKENIPIKPKIDPYREPVE